jgi:hypothetical protein
MDIEILMTFDDNEIVPVALMIAEKQVLAVNGFYPVPIFQSLIYCIK